jgi:uncharacterized membrane protein
MAGKFFETKKRSLAKAITFRVLIVLADLVVVFVITRRLDITLGVVILRNIVGMILYFWHERIWNVVKWGKGK